MRNYFTAVLSTLTKRKAQKGTPLGETEVERERGGGVLEIISPCCISRNVKEMLQIGDWGGGGGLGIIALLKRGNPAGSRRAHSKEKGWTVLQTAGH